MVLQHLAIIKIIRIHIDCLLSIGDDRDIPAYHHLMINKDSNEIATASVRAFASIRA